MYRIEDRQLILPLIEEDVIENLNILGRIKNSKNLEIHGDSLENPRGFVLKDDYWAIPNSKDERVLRKILRTYPFPDRVGFCALPESLANKIKEELVKIKD